MTERINMMRNEHDESPDIAQRRFWMTMNARFGCMSGDKAPWVAACDSEIHRIKESIKIKRAVLAGKIKHTKLSIKRKAIRLIDLNLRKFNRSLMGEVYKSPVIWDKRKAIRITASQTRQLSN